jgi:hypothetical protein
VYRLDDVLGAATIAHGLAGYGNTALQGCLADKALWPQLLEQLLPLHHLVMVLDQVRQHREYLPVDLDHALGSAQLVALHI